MIYLPLGRVAFNAKGLGEAKLIKCPHLKVEVTATVLGAQHDVGDQKETDGVKGRDAHLLNAGAPCDLFAAKPFSVLVVGSPSLLLPPCSVCMNILELHVVSRSEVDASGAVA